MRNAGMRPSASCGERSVFAQARDRLKERIDQERVPANMSHEIAPDEWIRDEDC
jgi:hypothetical protein